MTSNTFFNLCVLIAILFFAVSLFILPVITLFKSEKNNKSTAYSVLLVAVSVMAAFTATAVSLFIFNKQNIILYAVLLADNILFIVLTPFSMYLRRKELYETYKKESENKKYIEKLKNFPTEMFDRAQNLLMTSKDLLNKTTSSIAGKKDISDIIYNYATTAFKDDLKADGAVLLIADAEEEIFSVKSLMGRFPPPYKLPDDIARKEDRVVSNFKYAEFKYGENVFTKIAKAGNIELIEDGSKSKLLANNGEEPFLRHGSSIFFPLISNEEVIGIVAVSRQSDKPPFDKYDAKMGENLAGYVSEMVNLAITINEANISAEIENIRNTSSKIQSTLLPKNFKKIPYLDINEYFLSAPGMCSDYYDVIASKSSIFILMSEITGKSIRAAIIMIMIRTVFYLIADNVKDTDEILNLMNKGITGKISIDHFASVSLVSYKPEKKQIEFIGAGTSSIMIWRKKTHKIELFQQNTDPIGIDKNSTYKSKTIPFYNEDILAVYTDGLIETLNNAGEQYGIKRLASVIVENCQESTKDIVRKIRQDIKTFIGRKTIHDDHSLLIIKAK